MKYFQKARDVVDKLAQSYGMHFESDVKKHFGHVDTYCRNVVREMRNSFARQSASTKTGGIVWADMEASKSFVGIFLQEAQNDGKDLSEDYIRDLVINFLINGQCTTAQAI